jgi:polyisoprenoid-binding protein YceI
MRLLFACLVGFFLAFAPAHAELASYTLVKEKSSLKFLAIIDGKPLEGRFTDFSADINIDPEKPELSNFSAEVATGSVVVSQPDVAKDIQAPDWLSTAAFPKASITVKKLSKFPMTENYYGDGELAVRGKKVPVTVNFQIDHMDEGRAIATGYLTLQRKDFGVGQGKWLKDDVVKNEVRVEFRVVAKKK